MTTPTVPVKTPETPHPLRTLLMAVTVTAVDAALLALALGGVGALLQHARARVLIVIWGVGSLVLGLLRPVRRQDVVERAPAQAPLLLALLIIPLGTPPLAALGERLGWYPLPGGEALRWSGVALVVVGLSIRAFAMKQLGPRFSPQVALQRKHTLETRGLYARIRHPGYLGAWLATLGAALAFGSAVGLAGVVLMGMALHARMDLEEAMLERRFGSDYAAYRARTGRLLPKPGSTRPV